MTYPATSTVLAPSALLADLARAYAIGTPRRCILWRRGMTDTYQVMASGQPYILRVYRSGWRTEDDVAYELDALRHFHSTGVPVALPIQRRDGRWFWTVQAPEGVRQIVLFSYAPGRAAYLEDGYARRWGRTVAAIHAASESFASAHARFALDQTELVDRPLAALAPLMGSRTADWHYLEDLADNLRAHLTVLRTAGLDWGFCHGDALGSDAHLEDDTLTVFDFDCCGPGWRAYDLATYRWIWEWHSREAAEQRWAEFVDGYGGLRPLGEADLAVVPLFVLLRELWLMGLHARSVDIHGQFMLDDVMLDRRIAFLKTWVQRVAI